MNTGDLRYVAGDLYVSGRVTQGNPAVPPPVDGLAASYPLTVQSVDGVPTVGYGADPFSGSAPVLQPVGGILAKDGVSGTGASLAIPVQGNVVITGGPPSIGTSNALPTGLIVASSTQGFPGGSVPPATNIDGTVTLTNVGIGTLTAGTATFSGSAAKTVGQTYTGPKPGYVEIDSLGSGIAITGEYTSGTSGGGTVFVENTGVLSVGVPAPPTGKRALGAASVSSATGDITLIGDGLTTVTQSGSEFTFTSTGPVFVGAEESASGSNIFNIVGGPGINIQVIQGSTGIDQFSPTTVYKRGDIVSYNNWYWLCSLAPGVSEITPAPNPALPASQDPWGPWNEWRSTSAYVVGAQVQLITSTWPNPRPALSDIYTCIKAISTGMNVPLTDTEYWVTSTQLNSTIEIDNTYTLLDTSNGGGAATNEPSIVFYGDGLEINVQPYPSGPIPTASLYSRTSAYSVGQLVYEYSGTSLFYYACSTPVFAPVSPDLNPSPPPSNKWNKATSWQYQSAYAQNELVTSFFRGKAGIARCLNFIEHLTVDPAIDPANWVCFYVDTGANVSSMHLTNTGVTSVTVGNVPNTGALTFVGDGLSIGVVPAFSPQPTQWLATKPYSVGDIVEYPYSPVMGDAAPPPGPPYYARCIEATPPSVTPPDEDAVHWVTVAEWTQFLGDIPVGSYLIDDGGLWTNYIAASGSTLPPHLATSGWLTTTNTVSEITFTGGGVTELQAGQGIAVNAATGIVSVSNQGVLEIASGGGIAVDQGTGNVTLTNTGVLSLLGSASGSQVAYGVISVQGSGGIVVDSTYDGGAVTGTIGISYAPSALGPKPGLAFGGGAGTYASPYVGSDVTVPWGGVNAYGLALPTGQTVYQGWISSGFDTSAASRPLVFLTVGYPGVTDIGPLLSLNSILELTDAKQETTYTTAITMLSRNISNGVDPARVQVVFAIQVSQALISTSWTGMFTLYV